MFVKFLNSGTGKVLKSTIISFLIFTLTFANVLFLVPYILESNAADIDLQSQESKTNDNNVQFSVKIKDNDKAVYNASKTTEEELTLCIGISTENGYLIDNEITFENANFVIAATGEKSLSLEQINSGEEKTFEVPIKMKKIDNMDINFLTMNSQIDFKSKYIHDDTEGKEIQATRYLKIEWLPKEEIEASIYQELITNKIYNLNGENKRIIQFKVNSNLSNGEYPIKETKIELDVPQINETKIEKAVVVAYSTEETNGKNITEFGKNNYSYNEETNKLTILLNNYPTEDNKISWLGSSNDVYDSFVVTYVYDANVNIEQLSSIAASTITLYNDKIISNENKLETTEIQEIGNEITIKRDSAYEVAKGNMYIGEETEFEVDSKILVAYSEIANKMILKDDVDSLTIKEIQATEESLETEAKVETLPEVKTEEADTYYKKTIINVNEAKSVLGEEGKITVYNDKDNTVLFEINLKEINEESLELNYNQLEQEERVKLIRIETTKPVKEGILSIKNLKTIKVENRTQQEIENYKEIKSLGSLKIENSKTEIIDEIPVITTTLLYEPTTKVELSLDKKEISSVMKNNVMMTAILKTDNIKYKLFKNPTLLIELPSEVTDVVLQSMELVYDGNKELEIESKEVITNELGNKVIKITLLGEQTKYNFSSVQGGVNILLNTKLALRNDIPNSNVDIKATCINGEEITEQESAKINIVSTQGLININKMQIDNNDIISTLNETKISTEVSRADVEKTEKIYTKIINNYQKTMNNFEIIGRLPIEQEDNNTKTVSLLSGVEIVSKLNVQVYYSQDGENWEENVTDFSQVKLFKIQVNGDFEQGAAIELAFNTKIPAELDYNEKMKTDLEMSYFIEEQKLTKTLSYMVTTEEAVMMMSTQPAEEEIVQSVLPTNGELEIDITTKTKEEVLHVGQVVTYSIKVTNNTQTPVESNFLEYIIPEGTKYVELVSLDGDARYKELDDESKIWSIGELEAGEKVEKEVKILIKEQREIKSTVNVKNIVGEDEVVLLATKEHTVAAEGSDLKLTLFVDKIEDNRFIGGNPEKEVTVDEERDKEIVNEGQTIKYNLNIKNNSNTKISNVVIEASVPTGTVFNSESQINKEWKNSGGNKISRKISIDPNEEQVINFELKLDFKGLDSHNGLIENIATASYNEKKTESNLSRVYTEYKNYEMSQTINKNTLYEGDIIEYTLEVKNIGDYEGNIEVETNVSPFVNVAGVYVEGVLADDWSSAYVIVKLNKGETKTIKIIGTIGEIEDDKIIEASSKISFSDEREVITDTIVTTVINKADVIDNGDNLDEMEDEEEPEDTDIPDVPVDKDEDEELEEETKKEDETKKDEEIDDKESKQKEYSISGLAWLDSNKDGIRNNGENILQGIKVILLNASGEVIQSTTSAITGTYKFNNVAVGKYIVVFEYDTGKYAVAKYRTGTDETINSDVFNKKMTINKVENIFGATDEIEIKDANVTNIDIGLVGNADFDLSLKKYISKLVVTNEEGTTTYNYENTDFAKTEIKAKYLTGTTLIVEYDIQITNEGDVDGYVTDIIDYIPEGFEFPSELNENWFLNTDKNLHCVSLTEDAIMANQTKTVKLILTKTLSSTDTGLFTNLAEIGKSTCKEGLTEKDSIAGNKIDKEDDINSASLLVSIKTGGTMMYIWIVIGCTIILAGSIYIINKRILKGGI